MISAPSIDAAGCAAPETGDAIVNSGKPDNDFGEKLISFFHHGEKMNKHEDADEGDTCPKIFKKIEANSKALPKPELQQLLTKFTGIKTNPDQQEYASSILETITGVLEGNGVSGDTDIAYALSELRSFIVQLGSEEKEAIMARMPQAIEYFQQPGRAAANNADQIGSILCPLENFSELTGTPVAYRLQMEPQLETGIVPGEAEQAIDPETVVSVSNNAFESSASIEAVISKGKIQGAVEVADSESQAAKDVPEALDNSKAGAAETESGSREPAITEKTRSGEPALDNSLMEKKADIMKAAEKMPNGRLDIGNAVTFKAETSEANKKEIIKSAADNAISKLSDILSAYEGQESTQFELRLEPENLGKLYISLSMSEDGLRALIRTEDTQVQDLLSSEISTLFEKLSENGVEIKSLDVICTDAGTKQFDGQNSGGTFTGRGSGSSWGRSQKDIQTTYEEIGSPAIFTWSYEEAVGSTVSYSA